MIDAGLAFAPAIALVMTVLLAALYINLGIRFHGLRVFVALAAGTWFGGQLLAPIGPLLCDVPWLCYVIAGLAAAALYLCFQALSRYITRTIAAQLDSLAAARQVVHPPCYPEIGEGHKRKQGQHRLEATKG